jgi:hypothetical protein
MHKVQAFKTALQLDMEHGPSHISSFFKQPQNLMHILVLFMLCSFTSLKQYLPVNTFLVSLCKLDTAILAASTA